MNSLSVRVQVARARGAAYELVEEGAEAPSEAAAGPTGPWTAGELGLRVPAKALSRHRTFATVVAEV